MNNHESPQEANHPYDDVLLSRNEKQKKKKKNPIVSPTSSWQTKVRHGLTPYLPPPLVRVLRQQVDPQLLKWGLGSEGSITLFTTLISAWCLWILVRFFSSSGSGRATVDDDDDEDPKGKKQRRRMPNVKGTVILCGPANSGKTRLFYQLCFKKRMPLTLTSLKPNIGISSSLIRYMDWPGHLTTSSSSCFLQDDTTLKKIWLQQGGGNNNNNNCRLVLVLDATQPVSEAAQILYQIWMASHIQKQFHVMVICCHKQDFPKCKNSRRIRIQLRTEMEKLLHIRKPPGMSLTQEEEEEDQANRVMLSWSFLQIHFLETSCHRSLEALQNFCQSGNI